MSLYSCYLTIEYIGHVLTSDSLGNSRKDPNQGAGGGGVEDMEFPAGVSQK